MSHFLLADEFVILADVLHMKRFQRGAYFDIIQAQKKYGHLPLDRIKKILGIDFGRCWPVLEPVLKQDDTGYYLEWMDAAIKKKQAFARSRAKNANSKRVKEKQQESKQLTQPSGFGIQFQLTLVQQMYNEWEIFSPEYGFDKKADFPALLEFAEFICAQLKIRFDPNDQMCIDMVLKRWIEMCEVVMNTQAWQKKALRNLVKWNKQEIYNRTQRGNANKSMIL